MDKMDITAFIAIAFIAIAFIAILIICVFLFSSCKKNVKFDVSADSNCVSVIVCPEGVKK